MKIIMFFRNPKVGHSIHRVFRSVQPFLKLNVDLDIFDVPSSRSLPWDVLRNTFFVFRKRESKAIHHVTGHIHDTLLGLLGRKSVLTIHDLVFIDNVKNPIKRFYKWLFWLYIPVKLADRITCISNLTKENILKYVNTSKIVVIPNPIDSSFHFVEKEFNESKPVILHVGTGWNKNLRRTILALKDIPCHLRVVGKLNSDLLTMLELNSIEYSNLFNLTDYEMRNEYIKCDIVNFPSEYEGFGMPVIEGQQIGRVVITSRIEPMIDISGAAAEFVDPLSIESIRKGYCHIISDRVHRDRLIEKGLQNVNRFSAENVAKQYLELYKDLVK